MLKAFERGAHKTGGGEGWADVWMKGCFAWEYKRKRRSLLEAYQQLLRYREDLENPPLLVLCDLDRFEIYNNFSAKPTAVFAFDLDNLAEPAKDTRTRRKLSFARSPVGLKKLAFGFFCSAAWVPPFLYGMVRILFLVLVHWPLELCWATELCELSI